MNGWMDGRIEWMDGWMDGWMNGWMNMKCFYQNKEYIYTVYYSQIILPTSIPALTSICSCTLLLFSTSLNISVGK